MLKSIKRMLPLLVAIVVLLLLFRLRVPNLLSRDNLLDLTQQISVNAIIAFGLTLVILIGGIDLSVGAVLALVGTATVYLMGAGRPGPESFYTFLAVGGGLLLAAGFGTFNGLFAARTKLPPFIITLATMQVARGAALRFNKGQPMPIPDSEQAFIQFGNGKLFHEIPIPVLVMLAVFLVTAIMLHRTRFGQHLFAIGGNREAARLSGIRIGRAEVIVYILAAVLTGIAGLIHTSQLYSAEPASGIGFELNAIAAVVVGGTSFTGGVGTIPGTFLGAIIIGILDKGLNQAGVHFSLQYVVKGLVILGAVYVDTRRRR